MAVIPDKQLGLFPSLARVIRPEHLTETHTPHLSPEQFTPHMPGQTALPVGGSEQRFQGRETDEFNPSFHDAPNAHVDRHGFIRDNTVVGRRAYAPSFRLRGEMWENAPKTTVHPDTQIHTLQGAGETSHVREVGDRTQPSPPRMLRVRGANVLIDGHHRVARARREGKPIEVEFHDTDQHQFGVPLHEMYGI